MAQGRQQSSVPRQRCAAPAAAVPAETPKAVCAQLEQMNRKLAAAHAEIRRYQTRLFACERQMEALRKENAELENACAQAQAECAAARLQEQFSGQESPQEPPQPEPQEEPEKELPSPPEPPAVQSAAPAEPEWQPKTELEHLSVELMNWFDSMMAE